MKRRWMRVVLTLTAVAAAAIGVLILTNPAPDVPVLAPVEAVTGARPYVIKLHARWCPVCMVTKDVWSDLDAAYAGEVRLVVFDFTSAATTERSRLEATRLGLGSVFDEYVGETGTVLVVDGTSHAVRHSLHGWHDDAAYRAAIDETLSASVR